MGLESYLVPGSFELKAGMPLIIGFREVLFCWGYIWGYTPPFAGGLQAPYNSISALITVTYYSIVVHPFRPRIHQPAMDVCRYATEIVSMPLLECDLHTTSSGIVTNRIDR